MGEGGRLYTSNGGGRLSGSTSRVVCACYAIDTYRRVEDLKDRGGLFQEKLLNSMTSTKLHHLAVLDLRRYSFTAL